jgi:ppGpp synthetase/RelA/SpoT-type nucleotidyltranferase
MPVISLEEQKKHIKKYESEQEKFKLYASVLKAILEKAKNLYAPLGFVEARAKKIESFSEKIIRKDKYKNPLTDMTDLCGARVITHFSKQVHEICHFIEQNFEIDTENSLDLKSKLRTSEFGYRSIHYIVIPRQAKILDIDIPDEIRNLKAEIQVRTFHEHIWADILHDRIYKSSINITEEWKRESARLAAMLEEADNAFAGMSDTIDQLSVNFQATPPPGKLKDEIEILKVLIQINTGLDDKEASSRLKLARIYNLTGEWAGITDILKPVLESENIDEYIRAGILREYGYAMCITELNKKDSEQYDEGISSIKNAIQILEKDPGKNKELALTYKYLASVQDTESRELLVKAHQLAPKNPYYFTDLLVEEFSSGPRGIGSHMDLLSTKIEQVVSELREHIGLGIEVEEAIMNIGKILFLQSEFSAAMEIYIRMMKLALKDQLAFPKEKLFRELKSIDKIASYNPFQATIIKGFLHLILWLKYSDKDSRKFLTQFKNKESLDKGNILIICGKSGELNMEKEKIYKEFLEEALRDFSGVVISGGTAQGIPGLIGTISASKIKNKSKNFLTLGYLPENKDVDRDYDKAVKTKSSGFSILEALYYWVDILFSDIKPENVLVFGMNGGPISSLEYKLALSIGAKVCLVGKLGGSAKELIYDQEWNHLPNLINIPNDPFTIWALVNYNKSGILSAEEVNRLAPVVHEFYRVKRRKELKPEKETDINKYRVVMKWDKLPPSLQNSNLEQVAFMEHIFKRGGLNFRKSDHPEKFIIHEKYKTRDLMAQLEHARWNAERLLDGWRFGPKDVLNKVTPYLVGWNDLDDDIKTYDYDPIRNFPELLMTIGYEVVEDI